MERFFENAMYASRWILAPVYFGLSLALIALTIKFFQEILHVLPNIFSIAEADLILVLLSLVDMTLVGGLLLLKRRLFSPRVRATTTGADILILSLLMVQCALGLLTIPFSAQHMDGSEMMKLVGWAQSVVTFHGGASEHLDGVAFIFRVHLVLGMTLFVLFPFSRLVHIWSAPVEYLTRKYQIVRARR